MIERKGNQRFSSYSQGTLSAMALNAGLKVLFSLLLLVLFLQEGSCVSCPSGWVQRQGTYDCYQFRTDTNSWDQARANCHSLEADLTSLDKAGEDEWVISQLSTSSFTDDYWIGLSDPYGHLVYVWSDGSIYDPNLADWASGRPSHSKGTKACVAMGVNQGWSWIDEDCGSNKAYVCHKTLTQPVRCDESNGWTEKFQNCYYTSTRWMNFDDAQEYCTRYDANLMDVGDTDEQTFLSGLVEEAKNSLWIGYKTMTGKDGFGWTSGRGNSFENWGANEPNLDTPEKCTVVTYQGSSTGNWSTEDCFMSRRFICERPTGMCYPGWRIHDGYCYQMVANSPTTWVDAKQQCEAQGSTLLTIKSEEEQEFINEQLPTLWQTGITSLWLGISDTIEDGEMKWTDGTDYDDTAYQNWANHKTPLNVEGESQCGSIYAGSSIGQWDYGDCFNMFDYSCKLREGAPITPVDPDKPTGYCPSDWYYYNDYCYYVDETGTTYTGAQQACDEKGGKLASIHSAEEMSFIELHLQASDYYIGLQRKGTGVNDFQWTDGTQYDYHNWDIGEPNNSGNQEDCVHVRGPYTTPSGVWNDVSCSRQYASICKKAADSTTPPPPTNPPHIGCYEPYQSYKGIAILTVDGDVCYNWKDANREYNPIAYPDKDLTENYCRNPNNAPKPWCYVEFGFKDCDVPECGTPVDCYEGDGYLYRGKAAKTNNGTVCMAWASLDNSAYYRPDNFPDEGLEGNYCRNPSGNPSGPWCYYRKNTFGYTYEYCGIPKCNTTGCYEGIGTNYRGTADEGEDGRTCVKWEDASGQPYNPITYPDAGLDHNYCRNPSHDDKPWCYVQGDSQQLVQESCDVPHCASEVGCYVGRGMSYRGNANYIPVGRTCSDWVDFINEFYPLPLNEFSMQLHKAIRPVSASLIGLTVETCAYQCLNHREFYCKGFNYNGGTDGSDSLCLLSTMNSVDVDPVYDPQEDYYERNQTYGLVENYCRNPNGAMAPWCYFLDPIRNETDWSYCGVPECNPEDVGCYDPTVRGTTYRGPARTTTSGHVCVEWEDTYYTPERFPTSGLDENYCRNPTRYQDAPFCYYKDTRGFLRSEYCDIPQCDIAEICGEGWKADPSEEWCYKIVTDSYLSFDQSQEECEEEDANLLSIISEAESNLIVGMIAEMEVDGFWIGANDRYHEAGWEWTDGSPFSYLNWQTGQPDNLHGLEECVLMSRGNGMWSDEQCDLAFPHICKKRSLVTGSSPAPTTLAPGSLCPTDWEGYGSHCYLVQQDFVGWSKALSSCDSLGASLASVHSEGEMTHIASMLSRESRQYYFFGANDIQKHGTWVYGNGTNDTPLNYLNWAEGQPDNVGGSGEDCVSMQYQFNWLWNDEVCEKKFQVVCENENNAGDAQFGRYTAHFDTMTFADAQAHCVKYEGTMATIKDDKDQEDMVTLLNSIYDPFKSDVFWLGVNDIKQEGHWVTGGDSDSTTTQTYFNWRSGEPNNNIAPGEHCGIMAPVDESDPTNYQFEWYDWSCDNDERFICEDIDPNSDYYGSGNHRYTVVNEPMTWSDAASYCKSKGGALAQVRTSSDQLYSINRMLSDNREKLLSSKGAWIGMNDLSHQMTFEWADGSEVTYTNWNAGEPDDFTDSQDCVFAYSQSGKDSTGREYYAGKWADYDCKSEDFGYVCQKQKGNFGPSEIPPPEYECPMGWFGSDVYCYKLLEGQMTWDEAVETCQENMDHGASTNTTLAYIPDYKEQDAIDEALLETTGLYWIGLHGTVHTGTKYHWETGQPVTFTNWDTQQPGNDQHPCVAVAAGETRTGQWDDQDCGSRYSALCQKPRHEGVEPDLPPTPSPSGACPVGWSAYESYCYLVVRETNETKRKEYFDASEDCFLRTYNFATTLASFHSHGEEQFVAGLVKDMSPSVDPAEEFWIGMTVYNRWEYYYWDDGSPLQYVHWGLNMPEGKPDVDWNGLVMYPGADDYGWEFIDINSKRSWICKTQKDTYMMTTLPHVSPGVSERCGDNWQNWTYNANLDTCYKFMGLTEQERAIWLSAYSACSGENSELVSIHSPEENKFVQDLTTRNFFDAVWTGLYSYSQGGLGFSWSDGSPAEYFKWDEHEPGNSVANCVKLDAETGGWRMQECDTQMAYVCKRTPGGHNYTPAPTQEADGFCPRNWFTWGNKCLRFLESWDTWTNQRNACQTLGGDLASIRDVTEQVYIVTLLESVPSPVWIGLNDRDSEGLFSWSDGTQVFYTNWDTNEPNDNENNEDCIMMFGSNAGQDPGAWNDAECTQRYRALCQIPRDPNGTPPSPTLSLCGSYHHYGNACYKIHNGSYTRDQAKNMCERDGLGSTLASINSIYEDNEVSLMMKNAGIDSPMYIGLTFANNTYRWDDTWPVVYTRWAAGQPSLGADEKCVVINAGVQNNGQWDDVPCSSNYGAICKFTQGGVPPQQPTLSPEDCPGSDWSVHGSACYKAYLDEEFVVSWSSALYVCQEDRASLVSIHSDRERDFVVSLTEGDIYSVWIGLNNIGGQSFSWQDESPVEYVSWAPGEPSGTNGDQQDEECTQMYTSGGHVGQWNDLYCLEKWPFICKYTTGGPVYRTTPIAEKPKGQSMGIGAIVGIAIGGVAFIVIVAALVVMLRRQKRMVSYFRSVAGLEVAPEQLFNEDSSSRGDRTGSFDDAMLSVN